MGRYTSLPTLDVDFIKPKRASFDRKGGAIDSSRNGVGESISIDFSGGGILTCSYEECFAQSSEEHEYMRWVAARMRGSHRFMNVPIITDWAGPFPLDSRGRPMLKVSGITHSDGSTFSDGTGYSQTTVWGVTRAAAALGAGKLKVRIYGASRRLRWSDWFSIYHDDVDDVPGKGWRAYCHWETTFLEEGTQVVSGATRTYQEYELSLDCPLRQAVANGTRVEFVRPRSVMKFATGFTAPWALEDKWIWKPSLQFTEAF